MKSLPPLETVFPSKLTQENKSAELFDRLRTLTLSLKEDHSRPFYSIRQIARHTGESATLVARAYRKLELEGHLLILRSKETLVSGKKIHPLYTIKGVIGFPVWGYGFFHIHDLRSFYLSLINHLKKNHFAVDLIFIDDDLEKLQREILPVRHNVIVWYEPLPEFKQMMQVSQEQGVRNLILSKEKKNSGYRDYQLDWKEALKKALTHWLKTGIKYVTIPVMQESTDLVGGVLHSGKQGDLQFQKYYCPDEKALKELTLRLQGNKDHGVYFENDMDLHLLSRRHGQALCDLFAVTRVLISHSFDAHPAHYVPGHKADVAEMDWDKAAHSIALDIIRHQLSPRSPARIYRAVFKNDIPLNTLASEN